MNILFPLLSVDIVAKSGSIRKAAETLSIDSTALNRRILAIERELGFDIFERIPRGVRLTTAGEILVHHIRTQSGDFERVKSQIADLSGERRGHVSIACSQALLPYLLPEQISSYLNENPGVQFSVLLRDRAAAEQALVDYSADLVLVFEPIRLVEFQNLLNIRQPLHVVMSANHPLTVQSTLRLRECLDYPIVIPTKNYGVRNLLELAVRRIGMKIQPVLESDSFEFLRYYTTTEDVLGFQIPIGLPRPQKNSEIASRPIATKDIPPGLLYFGQLKGRTLPVAAARFAQQIIEHSIARFECD